MTQLIQCGWSFADHVPYSVPASLDDLNGPTSGCLTVDGHIDTSPYPGYELDQEEEKLSAYSAIVRDGVEADHVMLLNKDLLIQLWPDLNLPRRCRELWTARFDELAQLPVRALVV